MFFMIFPDLVAIWDIKLWAKLVRSTHPLKLLPWRKTFGEMKIIGRRGQNRVRKPLRSSEPRKSFVGIYGYRYSTPNGRSNEVLWWHSKASFLWARRTTHVPPRLRPKLLAGCANPSETIQRQT